MDRLNDLNALALTMIGEARGEGLEGMRCVGHTIMNRELLQSWRGKSVKEVCTKPFQYSCWNADDPNKKYLDSLPISDPLYVRALYLAAQLLSHAISDLTNGATYYHTDNITLPKWAVGQKPIYKHGHHIFYKDIA